LLTIKSPITGVVRDVQESLHVNRWINQQLPVATVLDTSAARIRGLVSEADLHRIAVRREVKFIPDDPARSSISGVVNEIEAANVKTIVNPMLASVFGGQVPSRFDDENKLVPEKSMYLVRISVNPDEVAAPEQELRGVARITGEPDSMFSRMYESAVAVLIRESGF
jgi:putative peptide zinc metalloprotease protein